MLSYVCLRWVGARSCWPGSCPPLRPCLASHLASCASLLLLQAHYRDHGQMLYARSLLVVHNLAHQGGCHPRLVRFRFFVVAEKDGAHRAIMLVVHHNLAHQGGWWMHGCVCVCVAAPHSLDPP